MSGFSRDAPRDTVVAESSMAEGGSETGGDSGPAGDSTATGDSTTTGGGDASFRLRHIRTPFQSIKSARPMKKSNHPPLNFTQNA